MSREETVTHAVLDDDDAIGDDPFDDDLASELAAAAPRPLSRTTLALAAAALVVGGFLAGAQVQKHYGVAAAGPAAGTGLTGAQARTGNQNAAGGANRQGPTAAATAGTVTTGTVKLVDGTTVYVQTANGDVITVRTNATTTVLVSKAGALADLAPGATVTVEGQSSGTGTVTATKVTKDK